MSRLQKCSFVIPSKDGIQVFQECLDPDFCRGDGKCIDVHDVNAKRYEIVSSRLSLPGPAPFFTCRPTATG
jgi:hypothetical protein